MLAREAVVVKHGFPRHGAGRGRYRSTGPVPVAGDVWPLPRDTAQCRPLHRPLAGGRNRLAAALRRPGRPSPQASSVSFLALDNAERLKRVQLRRLAALDFSARAADPGQLGKFFANVNHRIPADPGRKNLPPWM